MRVWLALAGALIAGGGAALGATAVLTSEDSPTGSRAEPVSTPGVPPDSTPAPPSVIRTITDRSEASRRSLVCLPDSFVPVDVLHVNISGKEIPLPGAIAYRMLGSGSDDPGGKSYGVYFGQSSVRFDDQGVLMEHHVEPEDAGVLDPLVNELSRSVDETVPPYGGGKHTAPRIRFSGGPSAGDAGPPPPNLVCIPNANMPVPMETVPFVTIGGKDIPMPPGVVLSSVLPEPGPEFFMTYYRDSWVKFRGDVLLDSHVEPEDAEALAPLLNELQPQ